MQATVRTCCMKIVDEYTFLIGRASRLAQRTVQQPYQVGGMNYESGRFRMREDARVGQTAASTSRSHTQKTRIIPKNLNHLRRSLHESDAICHDGRAEIQTRLTRAEGCTCRVDLLL